jgi:hypothetical protein
VSVVHLTNNSPGAPVLSSSAGSLVSIFNWAMPQLGWTLVDGDEKQVAYKNPDEITVAIFDDNTLPEYDGAHLDATIYLYHGFVSFANRGVRTSFKRHITKIAKPSADPEPSVTGYLIWGDAYSAFIVTWCGGTARQPFITELGRHRWYGHYFGKLNGILGPPNYGVYASSITPITNNTALSSALGMTAWNTGNHVQALFDVHGNVSPTTLQFQNDLFPGVFSFSSSTNLGNVGHNPIQFRNTSVISRILLSIPNGSNVSFQPPLWYPRGLYAPVGNWSSWFITADSQKMASLLLDVGSRSLRPLYTHSGYSTTTTVGNSPGDLVFLDDEGPW